MNPPTIAPTIAPIAPLVRPPDEARTVDVGVETEFGIERDWIDDRTLVASKDDWLVERTGVVVMDGVIFRSIKFMQHIYRRLRCDRNRHSKPWN